MSLQFCVIVAIVVCNRGMCLAVELRQLTRTLTHVRVGEGAPAGVRGGRAIGGRAAEVGAALAGAVLLQVAGHILAGQAGRYGAHVIENLGGDCLVGAKGFHSADKPVVQLCSPLNLRSTI